MREPPLSLSISSLSCIISLSPFTHSLSLSLSFSLSVSYPILSQMHTHTLRIPSFAISFLHALSQFFLFPTAAIAVAETMDLAHRPVLGLQLERTLYWVPLRRSQEHRPSADESNNSVQAQISPWFSVGLPTFARSCPYLFLILNFFPLNLFFLTPFFFVLFPPVSSFANYLLLLSSIEIFLSFVSLCLFLCKYAINTIVLSCLTYLNLFEAPTSEMLLYL